MSEQQIDHDAARLLSPLAGEPAGPARLDVARAMAEGNRRRRTRWLAGGAAVVALTATTAAGGSLALSAAGRPAPSRLPASPAVSVAAPPTSCTVTALTAPGADGAMVTSGDSSGRWLVGRAFLPGDRLRLVVWHDGRAVAGTGMTSKARFEDINARGEAVGGSSASGRRPSAYLDGRMSTLAGGDGVARAINDAGMVAGSLGPASQVRPVRWASTSAQPEPLPLPAGARYGTAVDIDESGTVVGTVTTGGDPESRLPATDSTGYLWLADGTGRPFPLPDVDGRQADGFEPMAIRNGWVIGRSIVRTHDGWSLAPVRYRIETGRYEQVPAPRQMSLPVRVAANGTVPTGGRQPGITDAAGRITLLPKDPAGGKDAMYDLTGISDDGRTAAGGVFGGEDVSRPLLWRCR